MPVACSPGTSLKAMNIFYNTPGRRKHLEARKESTELMEIWREFAKVALANPQISFTLRGAGKYDKILPASSLKERIIDIGGAKLSRALIPVSYESAFCTIPRLHRYPPLLLSSREHSSISSSMTASSAIPTSIRPSAWPTRTSSLQATSHSTSSTSPSQPRTSTSTSIRKRRMFASSMSQRSSKSCRASSVMPSARTL